MLSYLLSAYGCIAAGRMVQVALDKNNFGDIVVQGLTWPVTAGRLIAKLFRS